MEKLIRAGLVHCNDINALRQECLDIGNTHRESAARNRQPRPVVNSNVCFGYRQIPVHQCL